MSDSSLPASRGSLATSAIQSTAILTATWLLWRIAQRFILTSVLHNIPGPPSESFWKGNLGQYFTRHGWDFQLRVAQDFGPVVKIHGLFCEPMLYIYDSKALHTMFVTDQHLYEQHHEVLKSASLMFGPGLLAALGEDHRRQRRILNPVFSTSNLRQMLPVFYEVAYKLRDAIGTRVEGGAQEIDMLNWAGRAALELIGRGGIGHSFDPLVRDVPDQYAMALKALLPTFLELNLLRQLVPYVSGIGTASFRRHVIDIFPHKQVQKLKSIVDLVSERAADLYTAKKTGLDKGAEVLSQQIGEGKDILSVLMKANTLISKNDRLAEAEIIAQVSSLIFAAMDTTSNTLGRILHRLAEHPDIQEKVREEVAEARSTGEPSFDELMHLPWLNAVYRETLRLDPPANLVLRTPIRDTVLPLSTPISTRDGKTIHEVAIPKGTNIIVGILGCNINRNIWGEDVLEWRPQRWLSPLPSSVVDASIPGVYTHLMTFLGGPRACIGFKFAEMEIKAVLSVLLSAFTFNLTGKPIVWNVASVRYPTVGTESNVPQLPLKVELSQAAV